MRIGVILSRVFVTLGFQPDMPGRVAELAAITL